MIRRLAKVVKAVAEGSKSADVAVVPDMLFREFIDQAQLAADPRRAGFYSDGLLRYHA